MRYSFFPRADKINKSGLSPIRMLISVSGDKIFRTIKNVSCLISDWDSKKEEIKPPKKGAPYNFYIEYNREIEKQQLQLQQIQRYILLNDLRETKKLVLRLMEDDDLSISKDFFSSFKKYLEIKQVDYTAGTLRTYLNCMNFFLGFEIFRKEKITFDQIDLSFFDQLKEYAFMEKELQNNYFATLLRRFKTFMKWTYEREYHNNDSYTRFKFSEKETEVVYLTQDELMQFYRFPFKNKKLDKVRDIYCFSCFTGLRYSDNFNLTQDNVFENELVLAIQKTQELQHRIPLNSFAKEILDKYKNTINSPLPKYSQVKLNQYLKVAGEEAGINSMVHITRFSGNKRMAFNLPKYKLMTTHTARKTFATVSILLGMNPTFIKKITGHKTDSAFRRYYDIANDQTQKAMTDSWNKIK